MRTLSGRCSELLDADRGSSRSWPLVTKHISERAPQSFYPCHLSSNAHNPDELCRCELTAGQVLEPGAATVPAIMPVAQRIGGPAARR